ncbi:MAG: hypothetical protein KF716_22120 [Anaerolineae bacterium]|nr:hypothetical protein [Anaerolineae bacterium]
MALTLQQAQLRRDEKVRTGLGEFAPIWLTEETYRAAEESLFFYLIYAHPSDGLIKERFKYDAFNDVLYHMGARKLSEAEALAIQEQPPYLDGDVLTQVKNVPQFRAL